MLKTCNKVSLALALAAVFAAGSPAMAASVNNGTPPNPYSYNVGDVDLVATNALPISETLGINIATSDQIIGRTTGFAVKITLPAGVTFDSGSPNPTFVGGSALVGGWAVAAASGTGAGQSVLVVTFSPNGAASTVGAGQLVNISAINLKGVSGSVNAAIQVYDPVTTANILNSMSVDLVNSVDPLQYSVGIAQPNQRIDVGSGVGPSRTLFSPSGAVDDPGDRTYFDAGTLEWFTFPLYPPLTGTPIYNGAGTQFNWWANDLGDLTLTGNFSTFQANGGAIYLSAPFGTCAATVPGGAITATINAAGTSADFGQQQILPMFFAHICFVAPGGTTVINATPISTHVTFTRAATGKTDAGSAPALAMMYNGPVQTAFTFNPATNSNQESFLRISNTSGAAGQISITAVDDTGHQAGPVTFILGAAQSLQLSSSDLENGNAAKGLTGSLGHGTGKWIVTVVGQIGSMEVTNLNRNNSSGTLNNLGVPVTGHGMEQHTEDVIPQGH